jgi:uncharacterized protein
MVMRRDGAVGDILGTGWQFPVRVNGRGAMALARHENDIEQSMQVILSTAKGERRMRPDFGCRIHELIFAPNNATSWGLVRQYVEEALGWWEPRIDVMEVKVGADAGDTSRLIINIKYRVKATSDERSLIYPFYLSR